MARKDLYQSNIDRLKKLAKLSSGESKRLLEEAATHLEDAKRITEETDKMIEKYLSQTPIQRKSQQILNDMETLIKTHNIPKKQLVKFDPNTREAFRWYWPN